MNLIKSKSFIKMVKNIFTKIIVNLRFCQIKWDILKEHTFIISEKKKSITKFT
jgi:hypothetical protein